MIVAICMKEGVTLPTLVHNGIESQSIKCNIHISYQSPYNNYENRDVSINKNSHKLQGEIDTQDKYILLMDSDVVITDIDAISKLVQHLESNPLVGCVAIPTKDYTEFSHICCALALIRYNIYKQIQYLDNPTLCQCSKVMALCNSEYIFTSSAYEIPKY